MSSKQQSKVRSSQNLNARQRSLFGRALSEHIEQEMAADVLVPMPPGEILDTSRASEKVSLQALLFISKFCRRNLSADEISVIGVFIDAAFTNPDTTVHEFLCELMDCYPQSPREFLDAANDLACQIAEVKSVKSSSS